MLEKEEIIAFLRECAARDGAKPFSQVVEPICAVIAEMNPEEKEWEEHLPFGVPTCPNCGGEAIGSNVLDARRTRNCPHCGQRMKEKKLDVAGDMFEAMYGTRRPEPYHCRCTLDTGTIRAFLEGQEGW